MASRRRSVMAPSNTREEWSRAFNSGTSLKEMDIMNISKEGNASDDALQYLKDFLDTEWFARS